MKTLQEVQAEVIEDFSMYPPAPKSLHFLMSLVTSGRLNNLWIFLSVGALPF